MLTVAEELLGTRYCEPTRMIRKQRRNTVKKSTLQYCVQGTFNCEDGDERGEPDARWQTVDELVKAACSLEEFDKLCAAHMKELQKTMKQDTKRFKSVPRA